MDLTVLQAVSIRFPALMVLMAQEMSKTLMWIQPVFLVDVVSSPHLTTLTSAETAKLAMCAKEEPVRRLLRIHRLIVVIPAHLDTTVQKVPTKKFPAPSADTERRSV